jgi:hypothetical protein
MRRVNAHEGSRISRETLQVFFLAFGEWFVERFYNQWIKIPTTAEELLTLEKPFRMVMLPCAVCSQDGVHVGWSRFQPLSGVVSCVDLVVIEANAYDVM